MCRMFSIGVSSSSPHPPAKQQSRELIILHLSEGASNFLRGGVVSIVYSTIDRNKLCTVLTPKK